jgi:hypothetical protein|tara:strand:- start:14 stop:253 length:240 start_codon:yes stop_codon:yes gene_type:complete
MVASSDESVSCCQSCPPSRENVVDQPQRWPVAVVNCRRTGTKGAAEVDQTLLAVQMMLSDAGATAIQPRAQRPSESFGN